MACEVQKLVMGRALQVLGREGEWPRLLMIMEENLRVKVTEVEDVNGCCLS